LQNQKCHIIAQVKQSLLQRHIAQVERMIKVGGLGSVAGGQLRRSETTDWTRRPVEDMDTQEQHRANRLDEVR